MTIRKINPIVGLVALLATAGLLAGCGKKPEEKKSAPPAALIGTAQAQSHAVEVIEESVGSLETLLDPKVGAEVAGRVTEVRVHAGQEVKAGQLMAVLDAQDLQLSRQVALAEIARIEALLGNQKRVVERNQRLVQSNFISQAALDDTSTQEKALTQQLASAKAQLAIVERNIAKTRVTAPVGGRVESAAVAAGSYVKVGDPMFQVVASSGLRAHLPFPESVASRLKVGLKARLSTPTAPDRLVEGSVSEIKPMVGANSRALDVIVRVNDAAGWKPGASVNGAVVIGERKDAVTVPEQSVVLRPAGKVVYVIREGKAYQRLVETGVRREGWVEIVSGLRAGETVAVEGAGFLIDQAAVKLQGGKS